MLLAKKHLLSLFFIISFAVFQFNSLPLLSPVRADDTLLNSQSLLKDAAANNYGNSPKDVRVIILRVIKTLLQFLAFIVVILIIFVGFQYMTSGGNEAKTKEAIGHFKALIIGLIIILASWGITRYILNVLICTTTADTECRGFW